MSKENAKKFYEALKTDKALAEELQSALKAQKIENDDQATQVLMAFAGNKGFAFTAAELAELESEVRELSDDELAQVSAAGFCFFAGCGDGLGCSFCGSENFGKPNQKTKCCLIGWN